jgi:hypothetical protein
MIYTTLKFVEAVLKMARGRIMEEVNQIGYVVHICGDVTTNPPVQLICTNEKQNYMPLYDSIIESKYANSFNYQEILVFNFRRNSKYRQINLYLGLVQINSTFNSAPAPFRLQGQQSIRDPQLGQPQPPPHMFQVEVLLSK